ncbi:hypothetical protein ACQR1Y_03125 [Bradyrhizobium sp. HKCCYLRH3099]|uniref:hypothetical protein n=1 Tax=unclassified Bradyrhizobium TaxID=2631580 RepID=UPI003EB7BBF3
MISRVRDRISDQNRPTMELIGDPPELAGLPCEAFICEAFIYKADLVANANLVYLRFAGIWHQLVLDCGVIFWRRLTGAPSPDAIDELAFQSTHTDVGAVTGVVGQRLRDYRMSSNSITAEVRFCFENGCTIIIDNADDRTTWRTA